MKYIDLARKADEALRIGIEFIVDKENILPSAWDTDGLGWHEQWRNAVYAGVYASCEGIILLSHVKQKHLILNDTELINKVYFHNLCHIFDERNLIDLSLDYGPNRKMQRDKTLNATYKLAKFLWASSYVEQSDPYLCNQILNKLNELYNPELHMFKNTATDQGDNILATIFAYIALTHLTPDNKKIKEIEEVFYRTLEQANKIDDSNFDTLVFILWGISQNPEHCQEMVIEKAVECIKLLLKYKNLKNDTIYEDRYNIRTINTRDDFSINKYFILLIALEQFIYYKYLNKSYVDFLIPEINTISDKIRNAHFYSKDDTLKNSRFWENCYALHILDTFSNLVAKFKFQEDNFMIIKPKNFKDITPVVDKKLCAVLMPFNNDWSDEVYDNFADVDLGFRFWRSDKSRNDGIIIDKIWEKINNAYFVIADCTGKNPNVFYELGIAHTLGKPVFLCAQNREDFPFDVTHIRSHVYSLSINGQNKLRHTIRDFIQELQEQEN